LATDNNGQQIANLINKQQQNKQKQTNNNEANNKHKTNTWAVLKWV
jgi:hypothetical protein